jgi:acyl transferase domain-containing protein
MSELEERIARLTPAQQELLRLRAQRPPPAKEGIAVIGMACRFPGGSDCAAYWSLLERGGDAITTIPPSRWPVDDFYDPRPATPGRMNTRWAGLIEGCDDFDPSFFGIAPREAERMDPQQRLLLEVCWQALEDAGVPASSLAGSASGVYVAVCGGDFGRAQAQDLQRIDAYVATGGAASIAANRLSYFLDLRGPSLAIDTACSSSLVALHLACRSLRQGECDLALVGGVNLLLTPEMTIAFSQAHMMAGDGRCKTFDAAADGYVRSEGCGMVVLRRVEDARSGGDRIRAVVRGTAVNQDGRSNGLTAPNGPAQQAVIRQCLADAGIGAGQVGYVELHGTGTPLGDPIEVHALTQALAGGRAAGQPLLIGAVKANIGHLEAAAGMAGMIKVILSMEHGVIPPQLHLTTVNPRIDLGGTPVSIVRAATPWPQPAGARLAGVSSFGFGGTNAHVLLGDPPPPAGAAAAPAARERPLQLLPLSARSAPALRALAGSWAAALAAPGGPSLAQACALAQLGRSVFDHRLALVAPSAAVAAERLRLVAGGEPAMGATTSQLAPGRRPPGVAFLFTGQGGQHPGMGRGLYEQEPVFKAALDQCAELCRPLLPVGLLEVMHGTGGSAGALDQTACTQPALFSLSYALCRLWQSWGIQPGALLGHSVGEYAAACVAGVYGLGDALTLICARARLMQALPAGGAMAALFADRSQVEELIARAAPGVAVAAVNAPQETVIAGGADEVGRLLAAAGAAGLKAARLKVSHAFHSALLEPMLPEFAAVCARIPAGRPSIPLVSNLSGGFAGDELLAGKDYWVRHARGTVRFMDGVRALHERGFRVFLEVGPQPTLITLGSRVLGDPGVEWLSSLHKGRDDGAQLIGCLARLQVLGVQVDWKAFGARRDGRAVTMPGYPFERLPMHSCPLPLPRRAAGGGGAEQEADAALQAPACALLGPRLSSPVKEPAQYAAGIGSVDAPWLADHRVFGSALLPATAFLAMAQAAAADHGMARATLAQVSISRPLIVPASGRTPVRLVLSAAGSPGRPGFQVFSREAGGAAGGAPWVLHAQGVVQAAADARPEGLPTWPQAQAACPAAVDVPAFYAGLASRGFAYGPAFQGIQRAWRGEGVAAGEVALPAVLRAAVSGDAIHPALLDACCQLLGVLVPAASAGHGDLYVPVGLDELALFSPLAPEVRVQAGLRPATLAHGGVLVGDLHLFGADGRCAARIAGLRLARVTRETLLGNAPDAPGAPAAKPRTLPPLRRELAAVSAAERRVRLRAFIIARIATILGRSDEQIDAEQPLNTLGFDSLMAGELSLDIEDHLGIIVPMERFREVPNIELITTLLLAQLAEEEDRTAGLEAAVDAMSDDEVERELRARLAQAGG